MKYSTSCLRLILHGCRLLYYIPPRSSVSQSIHLESMECLTPSSFPKSCSSQIRNEQTCRLISPSSQPSCSSFVGALLQTTRVFPQHILKSNSSFACYYGLVLTYTILSLLPFFCTILSVFQFFYGLICELFILITRLVKEVSSGKYFSEQGPPCQPPPSPLNERISVSSRFLKVSFILTSTRAKLTNLFSSFTYLLASLTEASLLTEAYLLALLTYFLIWSLFHLLCLHIHLITFLFIHSLYLLP